MIEKRCYCRIWKSLVFFLLILCGGGGAFWFYNRWSSGERFEVVNELGGNIFPSAILSTATTGTQVIQTSYPDYLGNPQVGFGIRVKAPYNLCRVRVVLSETPFFAQSISDFVLAEKDKEYLIFPDVLWNYQALKENVQSQPVSLSIQVTVGREHTVQQVETFSVRSINECLLGYKDSRMRFHDTGIYFAAYVNEEHPMIDQLLREALDSRIVRRFVGVQKGARQVDRQVYALWYMLQKRKFSYSSVSYSSLSSNIVYSQRVRTLDDALASSQINCVDGTVLFASLLRAINIEPVLIRIPGHMFVGYYTDSARKELNFLETTMIGDVNLDDYFPEENLDSLSQEKSQTEMSRITFDKAKEYATKKYNRYANEIKQKKSGTLFLEISKSIRARIQPIGR